MYFVTRGAVEVLLSLDSEPIKTLKSGSTFGETALLSSDKRNAYIRASEGLVDASIAASGEPFVELYVLSQKGLQKTLDRYPEIRTALEMDVRRRNEQLVQVAGGLVVDITCVFSKFCRLCVAHVNVSTHASLPPHRQPHVNVRGLVAGAIPAPHPLERPLLRA